MGFEKTRISGVRTSRDSATVRDTGCNILKRFNRDGVVHLKGVLTDAELDGLRASVAAQVAGRHESTTAYDFEDLARQVWDGVEEFDTGGAERFDMSLLSEILALDNAKRPIRDGVENADAEPGMFFYDAAGWRTQDGIRQAALSSALPSICGSLLDTTYVNFWEDTTFVKAPNTPQRTSFHQDYGYFQIEGSKCAVVWIPLDPVDKETGTMEYVRGSHLWGKAYAPNILFAQSIHPFSPFEKLEDIEANREDYDIISFDAEPGDVIIHHVMTIHGSRGNVSPDRMRRAMSFRYCGDDITYLDRPGALEQPYLEEKLSDGDPLYWSRDYPLVWTETDGLLCSKDPKAGGREVPIYHEGPTTLVAE